MQKGSAAVQKIAELFNAETRSHERMQNDIIRNEVSCGCDWDWDGAGRPWDGTGLELGLDGIGLGARLA